MIRKILAILLIFLIYEHSNRMSFKLYILFKGINEHKYILIIMKTFLMPSFSFSLSDYRLSEIRSLKVHIKEKRNSNSAFTSFSFFLLFLEL